MQISNLPHITRHRFITARLLSMLPLVAVAGGLATYGQRALAADHRPENLQHDQKGVTVMADETNVNSATSSSSSSSSSAVSSPSSSSIISRGQTGDCTVHAEANAQANGVTKSDHIDKVVPNQAGGCSVSSSSSARSPAPPGEPDVQVKTQTPNSNP